MGYAVQGVIGVLRGGWGKFLEWMLPLFVGMLGALQAFGTIRDPRWLIALIGGLVAERLLARFRRGSAMYQLLGRFSRQNSSFAGALDSLAAHLLREGDGRLSEEVSRHLCVALLRRVRHFAELALSMDEPLRAMISVPVARRTMLRVWCYDEPYAERRFSRLSLDAEGASAAFRTGQVQIIAEGSSGQRGNGSEGARQGVVSIPVRAGGPDGRILAVVSLDGPATRWFREGEIVEKVIPVVQPVINTLALTLSLRRRGVDYEFGY